MQFIYILPGWEGSTHDNRILRHALTRRNPLKVPQGINQIFTLIIIKKNIFQC